jgi:hypothetical protein
VPILVTTLAVYFRFDNARQETAFICQIPWIFPRRLWNFTHQLKRHFKTAALTKETCVLVPHGPVTAPVAPFQMVKGISTTCLWSLIVMLVCEALGFLF